MSKNYNQDYGYIGTNDKPVTTQDYHDNETSFASNSRSSRYATEEDTYLSNEARTKKKGKKVLCCRITKGICCGLTCCCLLIVVAIIILIVIAATFTVPTLEIKSLTPGSPQYAVKKSGLSKRQSFLDLFATKKFTLNDVPENTDITVNMIATLTVDNQNWYALPLKDQVVDVYVKSDQSAPIGTGIVQDNIASKQKSDIQIKIATNYVKKGQPPTRIQYLFDKCDGTNQSVDLVFKTKILVKSIDIQKSFACPFNLQSEELKKQIQDAQ